VKTLALAALALVAACGGQRQPQVYYGSQAAGGGAGESAAQTAGSPARTVMVYPTPMARPTLFQLDRETSYLLDPISRSCTLVRWLPVGSHGQSVAVPVDCATLAANHRDLAAILFWVRAPAPAPSSSTPPVAPATP
jgi:hypothetical protein